MLYQDIRPKTFDDVAGNESAVAALKRAVSSSNRAHCYLISGPSGCGKTTLARIAAQAFGCDPRMNVEEINAASSRGIDMARELERRAMASPLGGGNRATILDEAHRLTVDSQSALLKVLEDIPPWAYYFLCTTEPNKLKDAIRTRSEPIEVHELTEDQIFEMIAKVVQAKTVPDPGDDVLDEIARNAGGCPRRALVLLEQVAGLDQEAALRLAQSFESAEKQIIDLCRAVIKGQWNDAIKVYEKIEDKDPEKLRRGVLGYLKSALVKSGRDAEPLVNKMEELLDDTFNSGEPQLLVMLYRACRA